LKPGEAATSEWEFQGDALGWIKTYISAHAVGLDNASQEFKNADGRRSDVIVRKDHAARVAALAIELKTPKTKLSDVDFQRDAVRKAQMVGSGYVALWNMQSLALYRTPAKPRSTLLPHDLIFPWPADDQVKTVSDWLKPGTKERLRQRANSLMTELADLRAIFSSCARLPALPDLAL
jgi:hypothetical protein